MPGSRPPNPILSRRPLVALSLGALAALAVTPGLGHGDRAGKARPIKVDSRLPAWLAPGATLTVSGWSTRSRRLTLRAGDRRIATDVSGSEGRFLLTGAVPRAGRYAITVSAGDDRVVVGRVLVRPLEVAAAGDVTPGEGVAETIDSTGPGYPWGSVAPLLRSADIATANLEGTISSRGAPAADKEYHFRGGPGLLDGAARTAGIDVFTVANNHSLDFGQQAFLDTLRSARAASIQTVGGGASLPLARRPVIVLAGGLRVALLGYSDVRPLGFTATDGSAGVAPADPALVSADVRAARRRADLVIVWFHWGIELAPEPTSRQRELAAAAVDAGASLVLGAHSHVLQPVERQGRRLIAWSLGNFVFPAESPGTSRTGILIVALDRRGVVGARLVPATIHGFRPELDEPGRQIAAVSS